MASTFKNAGLVVSTTNNGSANLYTCPSATQAVIHALYISNLSSTFVANVDILVLIGGGVNSFYIGQKLEVDVNNTLVLDKPINLAAGDIIRVISYLNADSSSPNVQVFASVLEVA